MIDRARVAALYRYPVKGFTPEPRGELTITARGRAKGDRVWSLRFPHGTRPDSRDGRDYWPKGDGLCLRDFPSLARLRLEHSAEEIRLCGPGGEIGTYRVGEDLPAEKHRLEQDVTDFLLRSPEGRRLAGKLPLAFVGDGREPRFQDRPRGFLAAHSRSSLAELSRVMGAPVDEQRFRSNIAIEGLPAWAERDLVGRRVRIGEQEFDVHAPIVRCLAINANPDTGERDLRVLQSLTRDLGQAEPVFGVLLLPRTGTGYEEGEARIRVGEEFSVL